jgi:hypothetical protein
VVTGIDMLDSEGSVDFDSTVSRFSVNGQYVVYSVTTPYEVVVTTVTFAVVVVLKHPVSPQDDVVTTVVWIEDGLVGEEEVVTVVRFPSNVVVKYSESEVIVMTPVDVSVVVTLSEDKSELMVFDSGQ